MVRHFELREVTKREYVLIRTTCNRCGVDETDSDGGRVHPVAIEIDDGEEGGSRDEFDLCDPCLVELADVFVAAGSKAPLVTGQERETDNPERATSERVG